MQLLTGAVSRLPVTDLAKGEWEVRRLNSIVGNHRGRLAVGAGGRLFIFLPNASTNTMKLVSATARASYKDYAPIWEGTGLSGEPLVDTCRLEDDGILSLFTRKEDEDGAKNVVVADFHIPDV